MKMSIEKKKSTEKSLFITKNIVLKGLAVLIPIFQCVPHLDENGSLSLPLINYFLEFLHNPSILIIDFGYFFGIPGTFLIIFGSVFFIYSLIYQIKDRKTFIKKGSYKYIRHPQYVAIIIITFGFTIMSLVLGPASKYFPEHIFDSSGVVYIWAAEVLAYIILAKIGDSSLKTRYGEIYLNYTNKVPFMFPFLNLNKKVTSSRFSYYKMALIVILIIFLPFITYLEYRYYWNHHPKGMFYAAVHYDHSSNWLFIPFISILILFLISILIVITFKEYKNYFKQKNLQIKSSHNLSFNDIFENENRKKIIDKILLEPGIHNNELLRQCELQKGQLQWHLYVLMQYGIIKKKKIGQYATFFPINMDQKSSENYNTFITKSKTTFKILNMIEKNPGTNSSKIARYLNLGRSAVKYHIDKLSVKNLISLNRKGNKIELFPNQDVYWN